MVLNQSEPRAFNARGATLTAEVRNVGDGAAVSAKRSALSNSSDMSVDHSSSDSSDAGGTAASSGRLGLSELIDLIRSQGVEVRPAFPALVVNADSSTSPCDLDLLMPSLSELGAPC